MSIDKIEKGISIFIIGLSYKVILSNLITPTVDQIFTLDTTLLSSYTLWFGAILYSLQIYFDFHGYSLMAIGLGLFFGFTFPINFNFPYISKSITEFWKRWHITLSIWFRDYLYIPLGGNRLGDFYTYRNLVIVFLLCGLWHGAQWTFIVWGLYHGFFLILERRFAKSKNIFSISLLNNIYTLLVVIIGWVIFRAQNMGHAISYIKAMFSFGTTNDNIINGLSNEVWLAIILGIVCSTPITKKLIISKYALKYKSYIIGGTIINKVVMILLLYICLSLLSTNSFNPFIYFRF